ncbi:hypothetical protein ABBQ32_012043 [Trebouxia sp. C0010 RCD-2024]
MSRSAGVLKKAAQRLWGEATGRVVAGQPTPFTHPQLLTVSELTPGISAEEYGQRRATLASLMPANSFAVVPGAAAQYMVGMIPHPFRQDADFRYLTGLLQKNLVAVFESACRGGQYTLFVPDEDIQREAWEAAPISCRAAIKLFGADNAHPMSQFGSRMQHMVASASSVLLDVDRRKHQLPRETSALRKAMEVGQTRPLECLLHRMRWEKSSAEAGLMQASASATAAAMTECMQLTRPGVQEHQLAAVFEYRCKLAGAQRNSFPSVVAGGPDACVIHYLRNDKALMDGQLLLMDAGCERHGYASDVTRCWPVNGRFSPEQAAVYQIVQEVHRQCVAFCRPGNTLRELHHLSIQLLSEGLADLGVCGSMGPASIARDAYSTFYPHSVGHYLGGDVHDTASVGHDKPFLPRVTLAVEPGLYIPNDPAKYGALAGIGIRLEDDVQVTSSDPIILSRDVPIAMDEVEYLVGTAAEVAKHTL